LFQIAIEGAYADSIVILLLDWNYPEKFITDLKSYFDLLSSITISNQIIKQLSDGIKSYLLNYKDPTIENNHVNVNLHEDSLITPINYLPIVIVCTNVIIYFIKGHQVI
jgi:hypothetical protein